MKKLISASALALLLIAGAAPAQANSLISTDPTASQSLEAAPSAVTITAELPIMDEGSEVVVTDPLPLDEDKRFDGLTVLSIAPLLARAIREVFEDGSVTSLFDGHS